MDEETKGRLIEILQGGSYGKVSLKATNVADEAMQRMMEEIGCSLADAIDVLYEAFTALSELAHADQLAPAVERRKP